MLRSVLFAFCLAAPTFALSESYDCSGSDPEWTLQITQDTAVFDFGRRLQFDIPQRSTAEGKDWPRAMTLIASFDTAIVILDPAICETGALRAHVLTQRGQTPILLSGCCETIR